AGRDKRGTLRFDLQYQRKRSSLHRAEGLAANAGRRFDHSQRIHTAAKGFSSNSAYSATKAAIRSFARTRTTDLKERRIRVNAISPGTIDTPGLNDLLASAEAGRERVKMIHSSIPLGRFGTPDEIAKAVVFLASDDSSYITGSELFVDGGFAQV